MVDGYGRRIDYARVSVTGRCNLRCVYCRPEKDEETNEAPLSLGQILRAASALAALGIRKIRITGGEPLLRGDIVDILRAVNRIKGIEKVSLTTNGLLLPRLLTELSPGELRGLNISLNSLEPAVYQTITRAGRLEDALTGLAAALDRGVPNIKINCVAIAELNEGALADVARLARDREIAVRFIELMPVGLGKQWTPIRQEQIAARLEEQFGPLAPCPDRDRGRDRGPLGPGPAVYYRPPGFRGEIGFISALSHRFCEKCNRVRVTSAGYLKTCLHFRHGLDLRPLLEPNVPEADLIGRMKRAIMEKPLGHLFSSAPGDYEEETGLMSRIGG
jgi:cyclic pyranopterin phosphate synthase